MALTPTTLQTILTGVRQRTNMENNQFVTDPELTTEINKSLSQLDMMLVSKFSDYKLTSVILSVTNTNQLALPADFLKLRGVDAQFNAQDPDGYCTLRQFSFQKRNRKPYGYSGPIGFGPYAVEYRLQGQMILLEPAQTAAQWAYRVWYVPDFIPLVLTTDPLQSYMDSQAWYEYAVVDVAIKVLAKQDLDPSVFASQKAELTELILKLSAPNRDAGEPIAIVDTRCWDNGPPYGEWW